MKKHHNIENSLRYSELQKAYQNARIFINNTSIKRSDYLSSELNANIYFKLETEQKTGAFKFRGALNSLLSLSKENEVKHVVCASSGSHAMGMSLAGNILGIKITVFLPKITPKFKSNKIQDLGASIVFHGEYLDESQVAAQRFALQENIPYVSPYSHASTIQGNGGFIAYEIINSDVNFKNIFAPIGGGGLIAGLAGALKINDQPYKVHGIEAASNPSMHNAISLNDPKLKNEFSSSIAEALICTVSEIGYPLIKNYVDEFYLIDEEEIKSTMKLLYQKEGLKLEGAGAITSAAMLNQYERFQGEDSLIIVTGGNIEDSFFDE
jgi:threonine dehydratase